LSVGRGSDGDGCRRDGLRSKEKVAVQLADAVEIVVPASYQSSHNYSDRKATTKAAEEIRERMVAVGPGRGC